MKGRKQVMKKLIAILLATMLLSTCAVTAFAAGTDDGSITVINRGGDKFFGTEMVKGLTKYEAASGSGEIFYDANGDKAMNVCDLVAVKNGSVDFDLSGSFDGADLAPLRLMLIGVKN